jgi:hypothetical protein
LKGGEGWWDESFVILNWDTVNHYNCKAKARPSKYGKAGQSQTARKLNTVS